MKSMPVLLLIIIICAVGYIGIDRGWFVKEPPPEPPDRVIPPDPDPDPDPHNNDTSVLDGFLNEKESIAWLRNNGYHVTKLTKGYTVQKVGAGDRIVDGSTGAGSATIALQAGVTLRYQNHKIYIQVRE